MNNTIIILFPIVFAVMMMVITWGMSAAGIRRSG